MLIFSVFGKREIEIEVHQEKLIFQYTIYISNRIFVVLVQYMYTSSFATTHVVVSVRQPITY